MSFYPFGQSCLPIFIAVSRLVLSTYGYFWLYYIIMLLYFTVSVILWSSDVPWNKWKKTSWIISLNPERESVTKCSFIWQEMEVTR